MPLPLNVSFDTHSQSFPYGTPTPEGYELSINDTVSAPIHIPYVGPHEGTFPAVPEGHWTVSVAMVDADGTHIGTLVTDEIDVPADMVELQEPLALHLSVMPNEPSA